MRAPHELGGHSDGETPLPIPNREVKPVSADGTRGAIPRESRTPPISSRAPEGALFLCPFYAARISRQQGGFQAARSFSRHSGSSSRSRRTRSPTGGCETNSAASPSSADGFVVERRSVLRACPEPRG